MPKIRSILSQTHEYQSFRSSVPLKQVSVDSNDPDKCWKIYDCGPKDQKLPLICLPPVSGTADIYYQQCMSLAAKGYRVISAESPPYWSIEQWCKGFRDLLSHLHFEKVHIFGSALGGFLAQKFAEFTRPCPRVASLILCNSFTDSTVFKFSDQAPMLWLMPNAMLKGMVMNGLTEEDGNMDLAIAKACEFMQEKLDSLGQSDLASRLTLNCTPSFVQPHLVNDLPVTILDVWDDCALSQQVKDDVYKCYPQAKLAHLKSGGNFPFLSRSDEVNMHLTIHLRNFEQAI